jgi:hypothetical protein
MSGVEKQYHMGDIDEDRTALASKGDLLDLKDELLKAVYSFAPEQTH